MPGRNKTGPMGEGRQTGRGFGPCTQNEASEFGNGRPTRRFGGKFHFNNGAWNGWARSRMRGCVRRQFSARAFGMDTASPVIDANDQQSQETQTGYLRGRLDKIEERLDELTKKITGFEQ